MTPVAYGADDVAGVGAEAGVDDVTTRPGVLRCRRSETATAAIAVAVMAAPAHAVAA